MSTGRNDPCPCGSGKKYKKCCLLKEQAGGDELTPRILSRCHDEAGKALLAYAPKLLGPDFLEEAWTEFWCVEEVEEAPDLEEEDAFQGLFLPWVCFLWVPAEDEESELNFPSEETVAAAFLRQAGWKADELTRRFIEAARRTPLSFWQVEAVEADRGVLLRDMATDRELFVSDRLFAQNVNQWAIIFCQVIEVEGVSVFGGMGPYVLPPDAMRHDVEALLAPWKARLAEAGTYPALLLEVDIDLIWQYQAYVVELLDPMPPELHNRDGDRLELTTSTYNFDPGERGRLIGRLEALRNIERLAEGEEVAAELVWLSPRREGEEPQSQKATLSVAEDELETICNSRLRDRNLRDRLRKNLDDLLTYEGTEYEPVGVPSAGPKGPGEAGESEVAAGESNPLDLGLLPPEARSGLEKALRGQYMKWADEEVPALGGKTPRQMVATPAGRAEVEKMVNDWEHMQRRAPNPQFSFDFNELRRDLGLPLE